MFTGIVSDIGRLVTRDGARFRIASAYLDLALGNSVACDGCCLTIADLDGKGAFEVDVSNETASHTTLGAWKQGTRINLERSLSLADELGGHLVAGHVDGVARIIDRQPDGDSFRFVLEAPTDLARYIARKGSVALNGVSLTVNEVDGGRFGVNIIPFTLGHTNWGDRKDGDLVNLEVDLLARYVERIGALRAAT